MLVFIAADKREFSGLLRHLKEVRSIRSLIDFLSTGRLMGREVIMAANGPGPWLARTAAEATNEIGNGKLEGLISIGYCGALDETLKAGDIFVATGVNGRPAIEPKSDETFYKGPLVSRDRVISSASEKAEMRKSGAMAVEMEAEAVANAAIQRGVPFYCIRVVTDIAKEDLPMDFNQFRDRDGRFARRKIAAEAIRHPALIPALMKLGRVSKRASKALGDFLADCQF